MASLLNTASVSKESSVAGEDTKLIRVSIVEDDKWIREQLIDSVREADDMLCASAFASAEAALVRLPEDKPDIVLMDIGLPKMSGIECVRQLKLENPELLVLMLTVSSDSEKVFSALQAGANGYLLKRTAMADNLPEAIRQVCRGESPINGLIARQLVQYFNAKGLASTEVGKLAPRERDLLAGLAKGLAYKQIADELGISIETLRVYVRSVYRKLHVHSRGEAVARFVNH